MPIRSETERKFLELVSGYLVALPHDLRVLFEALSNPDMDRQTREVAAGAIVYVLSPNDAVPDAQKPIGFVDDTIMLRAVLRSLVEGGGEAAQAFRERFAEYYANLDGELELVASYLGDLYPWLTGKIATLPRLFYKGRRAADYVDDPEAESFLYEEGLAFGTDYDIDDDLLEGKLKRGQPILELMRRRRADEAKKIG